ncbi:hypothetical protein FB451DRAFT_639404 [Mycena latifolia]|nr:hypothetical protein FB451DRAFT_639404 [Mycena latifolia]
MKPPMKLLAATARARTMASYVLKIQELLDYTIDYLSDSHYDLISCALVAKSWVWRAQRHLYHHLDPAPDDASGCDAVEIKFHRFSRTLESAPHPLRLIRRVSIPLDSAVLACAVHAPCGATPVVHELPMGRARRSSRSRRYCPPVPAPRPTMGYLQPIPLLDEYFAGCSHDIQQLRLTLDSPLGSCTIYSSPSPSLSMPRFFSVLPLFSFEGRIGLESFHRGVYSAS